MGAKSRIGHIGFVVVEYFSALSFFSVEAIGVAVADELPPSVALLCDWMRRRSFCNCISARLWAAQDCGGVGRLNVVWVVTIRSMVVRAWRGVIG